MRSDASTAAADAAHGRVVAVVVKGAGVLLFVAFALGLFAFIDWWQVRESLEAPASLVAATPVKLVDGRDAVLVTTRVQVETGDSMSGSSWHQYGLIVVDAATGSRVVRRWWEEKHDQPLCSAGGTGRSGAARDWYPATRATS